MNNGPEKVSESVLQKELYLHLAAKVHHWILPNSCVLGWESDMVSVTAAGLMHEFEIKISRADFMADGKKKKHENLSHYFKNKGMAEIEIPYVFGGREIPGLSRTLAFPANYFWYCTPKGMLNESDIPEYAGLIERGKSDRGFVVIEVIKKAPRIHQRKVLDKMYQQMGRSLTARYWRYLLQEQSNG